MRLNTDKPSTFSTAGTSSEMNPTAGNSSEFVHFVIIRWHLPLRHYFQDPDPGEERSVQVRHYFSPEVTCAREILSVLAGEAVGHYLGAPLQA